MMSPKKKKKEFDWSRATYSHFLLKMAYVGTNYRGNAYQDPESFPEGEACTTVEHEFFEACRKMYLIEDRTKCFFSRCGRTDKGVHALGNYVSITLRLKPGVGSEQDAPYDYVGMLNRTLPSDIRILACRPVPHGFDARFNCLYRVYKYLFIAESNMDLEKMNRAAQQLIGEYDFRNFCKMDLETTTNHVRRIVAVEMKDACTSPIRIVEMKITGLSFLYHQIRCIMSILFLIATGKEDPSVIPALLDIDKNPQKPIYKLADETGLILYDCFFEGIHFTDEEQTDGVESFRQMYCQAMKMATVYATMANSFLPLDTPQSQKYTPLLQRARCPAMDDKIVMLQQKGKRLPGITRESCKVNSGE